MQTVSYIAGTFLSILMVGCVVVYGWLLWDSIASSRRNRIIYLSSSVQHLQPALRGVVNNYIPDTKKVRFIEAGAGHAYISRFMARSFPWKEVVAIEVSLGRLLLARLFNLKERAPIRFVYEDALAADYPSGSFIYCYLSGQILDELAKRGKFNGSLVASLSFPIPHRTATETVPLPNWQKQVFVYDFR